MPNRGKTRALQAKSREEANNQTSSRYGLNAPPPQSTHAALVDIELQRQKKRAARAAERKAKSETLKNTGNNLFQGGDYEAAIDVYQEAIGEYKATAILFSNLAAAYLKLEQYGDAEDAATEALVLDPKMIKARYRRGVARKESGHFSAALIDFQTVLEQDSTRTEAHNQMTETEYLYDKFGDEYLDDDSTGGLGYGWPYHDDEPGYVSDTESDSSDCHHVGNGVPCRFYNHGGCLRKDTCRYSHAPDDLSERDKLGRNVCLYSLLDSCKFGQAKCVYSHDRTFLPHGWWSHPEYVVLIKERLDRHEFEDQDSIVDLFRFYNRLHAAAAAESKSPSSSNKSAASTGIRFVLVLALDGDLEEAYKLPTIAALQTEITVKKALNVSEAITHLASSDLQAVFVADAAIVDHSNSQVLKNLVEFARGGGSVVMGGSFSSFVRFPDFATFFSRSWGLNWKSGSYHRATFKLNKSHSLAKSESSLLESYSMKALHVQGAASDAIVYKEEGGVNTTESPAVQVPFGKGHIGYIGDVNWENGSITVLLAMLHLSAAKGSGSVPPSTAPSTGVAKTLPSGGTSVTPASCSKRIETSDEKEKEGDKEHNETFLKTKFVLILAIDDDITDSYKQPTINLIKVKSPVKIAYNQTEALRLLSSDAITGVFVADAGITIRKNAKTLTKLVEYTKAGGTVVIGGAFSNNVSLDYMGTFFLKSWGVPWKDGSYHRTTFSLNPAHELAKSNPLLAQSYSMKALHVKDISPDVVVYQPTEGSRLESMVFSPSPITNLNESPAVRTRVGKGYLGYIGDVNWEDGSAKLLLAMMGLLGPQGHSQEHPKAGPSKAKVSTPVPSPAPKTSPVPQAAPPHEAPAPVPTTSTASREEALAPYVSTTAADDEGELRRLPVGPTRRPFLMILSFGNEEFFSGVQGNLLQLLRSKLEVLHGLSNERVLELLGSQDLVGILVTDAAIVETENAYILSRLVAFTKAGGTVVLGGSFSAHVKFNQLGTFFQDSWGLPWQSGDYTGLEITVNKKHELAQLPLLPAAFTMKALFVSGVTPQTALYVPARAHAAKNPPQSPVAFARVGNGRLGYIGDVGLQDEHSKIVLTMFKLSQ
ncbi:hypothetical protein C0992_009673 [Termitomyces sp. T32_za158]|nr:hypothetical protein C0992_009673 [Termitomyces sp. T32_za158]